MTTKENDPRVGASQAEMDAIILSMMQEVDQTEVAGEGPKTVHHRGDSSLPMPIMTASVTSAGYYTVYDTANYERSLVNGNMLPNKLKQLRPNGRPYFALLKAGDPVPLPVRGTIKCFLHVDNERRDEFDRRGFQRCTKSNIPSPFELERHMLAKHKVEWRNIAADQDRQRQDEDRTFQKTMLTRLVPGAAEEEEAPSPKAKRGGTGKYRDPVELTCSCGESFVGQMKMIATNKLRKHQKETGHESSDD